MAFKNLKVADNEDNMTILFENNKKLATHPMQN